MVTRFSLLMCILSFSIVACQRNRADTFRTSVPDMSQGGGNNPQDVPLLKNALLTEEIGACQAIQKLEEWGHEYSNAVSFLKTIDFKNNKPEGGLDIGESPFAQLYFGEKFVVSTPEEFLALVEEEYKKGNVTFLEYAAIQAAKISPTLLRRIQLDTTNKKLAEKFQGVFGEQGPLDKSVSWLLINKAIETYDPNEHNSIVTARLPLYSYQWEYLAKDVRQSLTGAVAGLASTDSKEKLCGFILWQRAFAQLLSFKGYIQPELLKSEASNPLTTYLEKLSDKQQEFKKYSRSGALFDPHEQSSVIASAEDLMNYDPEKRPLQVTANLPWMGQPQTNAGTLTDTLHFMESLVYLYAASSPSAPWFKQPSSYIFVSDILDTSNKGFIPSDAHNLALGLLKLNLKNLAKYNIVPINKDGTELKPGEDPIGFLPLESRNSGVSLKHVIQLIKISVYLDQALGHFKEGTPDQWKAMNPLYTEKILAQLVGEELFTPKQLETLLTPKERGEILKNTLVRMRLPLATLISQMAFNGSCSAHWNWDLATGQHSPSAPCDSTLKQEAILALRTLAMHLRAPLLYQISTKP